MAKRDSYEDDDDFLDEEIADWDEEEDAGADASADADVDEERDESDDDDDAEEDVEDAADSPVAADDVDEEADVADDEEEVVEEAPVEEEIVYPPDDEKALAALKKLRVRLDVNDKGNVWRAILDDYNGKDPTLVLLKGLPALKELWLLGTKVTSTAADAFKEEHPKIRVFF